MGEALILTFDIGTQSIRAMLCDKEGNFPAYVQMIYEEPFISEIPGQAEQEPDFYFKMLCKASLALKEKAGNLFDDIKAVTVTTIRDTLLCLDKDKKPLRNMILWFDRREAKGALPAGAVKKFAFEYAGMMETAKMQHSAAFCNWIKENEPHIFRKTDKFVFLPTYLNYLLTGVLRDCAANQIGHLPLNYEDRKWMAQSEMTRCVFDIPEKNLCRLVKSGSVIGEITDEAAAKTGIPAGLPLIATGSDKGCETLGLSVNKAGKAALSFGTSATVQFATKKYFEPQQFLPAYPAVLNDTWNPEIQIFFGYAMLRWFIANFAQEEARLAAEQGISPEEYLNKTLADIPAGCDGLIVQPYWEPGVACPLAKGTITGFTPLHTKYHIYRAIIEGINFALMEGMHLMEKRSKTKIHELFVAGGGSQSDEICQITADMFGIPVKRIHTHEASSLGASMVAFVALKEFKNYDAAIKSMVRICDVFEPDMKKSLIYEDIYENVYTKLYPKLLPVFKGMKKTEG